MTSDRIVLAAFSTIVLLLILFGSLRNVRSFRAKRQYFVGMLLATLFTLLFHVAADFTPESVPFDCLFESGAYICFYATLSLSAFYFTAYVAEKTDVSYAYAKATIPICAVFALGWCISTLDGLFFSSLIRGGLFSPIYWVGQTGGYAVFILILIIIFKNCRVLGMSDTLSLLSFIAFPVATLFLRYMYGFISIDIAIAVSEILIYICINMKQTERIYEQEILIQKYQIAFMQNQIRPHFIFNVLNSIYFLCAKDAPLAQRAIEHFSDYLRMNLALWEKKTTIPIADELNLVKNYVALEKLRFADELSVVYNMQSLDFFIPPFTLQPIVENAVKHGIMPKKGGGTIEIKTFFDGECFCVTVTDDGVGFAPKKTDGQCDGRIGISNVRRRLEIVCNGSLSIAPREGGGTSVAIRIPEKVTGRGELC